MMANDSFDSINHNLYLGSIYTGYTSPKNIDFITTDTYGAGSDAPLMGDGDIGIGTSSLQIKFIYTEMMAISF